MILIACDVDFRNMMEMSVQGRTNMIELYMSSQPKLSRIGTFGLGTFKTLKERVMRICDENKSKTIYYNQRWYDSFDPSDNKDENVIGFS